MIYALKLVLEEEGNVSEEYILDESDNSSGPGEMVESILDWFEHAYGRRPENNG